MISKNQIKLVQSLKIKKYRTQHGLFIAEGPKIAQDIIQSDLKMHNIYATDEWLKNNARLLDEKDIPAQEISEKELQKISSLKNPNQTLLVVHKPEVQNYSKAKIKSGYTLVLDRINDPGNLGTIIRTADWFGLRDIILSPDCADPYNPKTVQSTMGSIARMHLYYEDISSVLKETELSIYAADIQGENMADTIFEESGMILIGSEAHGLNEDIIALANKKIKIEGSGDAESLNAAIAASIIMYQATQRR